MSVTAENTGLVIEDIPLVKGDPDFHKITTDICRISEKPITKTPRWWWIAFIISGMLAMNLLIMIGYLAWEGVGVWGVNIPVGWGWAIVNFVFWVGIGHAGTLISAILFLFRQKWRTSINRFAEAMTICAVICAGVFPGIHVGRIWVAYFMFPVPNQMSIWPNFRSPLLWDIFAVGTYFTASALFWYTGMIPDLATYRDRAKSKIKKVVFGILSLGWRGGNRQWKHYEVAYLLLAGISTPLVLSVHSVVSTDFATSIVPGWHTTIFPPYFVAGAIFSGFAMVMTLAILARKVLPALQNYITIDTLERMAKIMMVTGMMVGYAYSTEFFIAWYSGNMYERFAFINRAFGPYWWAYWTMVSCNVIIPQLFWIRKLRRTIPVLFALSIFTNIGMWFERFVIVMSLHADYLPSSWDYYKPTWVDAWTFIGSFGLFLTLFLLFIRFLPVMAMSEVKGVLPRANPHFHHNMPPAHKGEA
ncbi:MAG: NrfD/PsrC family molybdoenzyme membrane anchor subunit [Candidatus Electryonea clarkiae]|nr:NrfD/PsrC family molybdoenzyme membrane anchor subunit [Candidatus Electryonea clarkiae]MDP8287756.1 NrfD/PsrC family molybdoenzyme membrane anchor subunit [Candidatus Electryonea clarkiae]